MEGYNPAALKAAGLGSAVGALAGLALGGIGVATGGVAIGIPALFVMTGAAGVFGSAGYTGTDVIYRFIHKVSSTDVIVGSSLLVVGTALLIDGARRVFKDARNQAGFSQLVKGVFHLANLTADIVCRNMKEFNDYAQKVFKKAKAAIPDMQDLLGGGASAAALGATGAAVGGAIAAGSVTVLGSSTLGGLALSLGLISAPVWPVIPGAAAGTAVGALAWTGMKKLRNA